MSDDRARDIHEILKMWDSKFRNKAQGDPSGCPSLFYMYIKSKAPHLLDATMSESEQYEDVKSILTTAGRI